MAGVAAKHRVDKVPCAALRVGNPGTRLSAIYKIWKEHSVVLTTDWKSDGIHTGMISVAEAYCLIDKYAFTNEKNCASDSQPLDSPN